MKERRGANVILIELVIVILFFMLASTTIVEVFGTAKVKSRRADVYTEALAEAQNLAEQLYLYKGIDQLPEHDQFVETDGLWIAEKENYVLKITAQTEKTEAGQMIRQTVSVECDGETLFSLPCDRYVGGGETK